MWAARAGVRACPCRPPTEQYLPEEPEPFLAAYLHSEPQPNEHNCSASKRISLEALAGGDHRPYTFFIAPGCTAGLLAGGRPLVGRAGRGLTMTRPAPGPGTWARATT